MSNVSEQIEDAPEVHPEVHPNSKRHEQKPHQQMPNVDRLHFDRVDRCEIQMVDPNAETCQTPASNVCHELGIVLCYGHVAAIEAIFEEQIAGPRRAAEAEKVAVAPAEAEAVAKVKEDETKRQEAPIAQKPISLGSILFGDAAKTDAGSSANQSGTTQN